MFNGHRRIPPPVNDPVKSYAPGSPERASIKARLSCMAGEVVDIPLIIGGKAVTTGSTANAVMPHDHAHVLGHYHKASEAHVQQDQEEAAHDGGRAGRSTSRGLMLKAAELLTTTRRDTINPRRCRAVEDRVSGGDRLGAEIVDFWRQRTRL
jgi:1-pyrroline-5-carboxylate dehydrogenase